MKSVKSCSSRIGLRRLARTRLRTLSCFFSQTRACVCLGCSPFRIERCWECCDPLHVVGSFCFHAHGQAWNEGWWREVARVPGMATCNMDFSYACAFAASRFFCMQAAGGWCCCWCCCCCDHGHAWGRCREGGRTEACSHGERVAPGQGDHQLSCTGLQMSRTPLHLLRCTG